MNTMDEWPMHLREFSPPPCKEEDRALVDANLAYDVSRKCLAGHPTPPLR